MFDFFFSKTPEIKENTFIVWEPCSENHSEVVPGFCRYLLDLGYHVSVLLNPKHYKEGLFCRFKDDENITYNKLSKSQIKNFFKKDNLKSVKGVLVTTAGKICDNIHYEQSYEAFSPDIDKKKIYLVEHKANFAIDEGKWDEKIITLNKLNYKGAKSTVVNPHYFGEVKITPKNEKITNFAVVGTIRERKRNNELIINSVEKLYEAGYENFKVTVIGKGNLKNIPSKIRRFFDIKGRMPFNKMYDEIEKADFFLTSYDEEHPNHLRYITSGTSGNFQLIYGFLKPCVIKRSFCTVNGFCDNNSVIYDNLKDYTNALIRCIEMKGSDYKIMQDNLARLKKELYDYSLENLRKLING